MIPPFDPETGYLPPGEHEASWEEFEERFGCNARRQTLLAGIRQAIAMLAAAGCKKVWVNGSFVTTKEEPEDFDLCWDLTGVDLTLLDPVFQDFGRAKIMQAAMFGGDVFPNIIEAHTGFIYAEFFQFDRRRRRKGIVVLHC